MKSWIRNALVGAAITGLAATAGATTATAATPPGVGFATIAYGSYVSTANGAVLSGRTSLSSIGCTNTPGQTVSNSAGRVAVSPGTVAAATSSGRTAATSSARGSGSEARVTGVNLLGGAVTADALGTSSTATVNSLRQYTGTNSSSLANLRIAGRAVPASVPPNTSYSLAAGGKTYAVVTLNGQAKRWEGSTWRVSTTALSLRVTAANPLGLPIGTNVVLAPSSAALTPAVAGYVSGYGYSTYAALAGGAVQSSPRALATPPCAGGSSSARLAEVNLPGRLTTGTTQTTASSAVSASSRSVTVKNTTSLPNIAGGLITARTIVADTAASRATGAPAATLTDRSGFAGLQVRGAPAVNDSVAPNTVVDVPGLGRVTFHKVIRTGDLISVTMIHIVLSQPVAGLPTGSTLIVGQSQSRLL